MLLDYLGETEAAKQIETAVDWCIQEGFTTEDINDINPVSCSFVGDMVELFIRKEGRIDFNPKNRQ